MRFRLSIDFDFAPFGNRLPANYQYELSAWVYHTMARGDEAYAEWLHQNGYSHDWRKFRMFTFSNLRIPKIRMEDDRLVVLSERGDLILSFLPERATEEFIKGVFSAQTFSLGDRVSQIRCHVRTIEKLPEPIISESMTFRTLSPMVITRTQENGKTTCLSPEEPETARYLAENLQSKYLAYYGKPFDKPFTPSFELLSPVKRKKITIKADTPQQTAVVGYLCTFRINLPVELMALLYETGVGEKGSIGFGMVEKIGL